MSAKLSLSEIKKIISLYLDHLESKGYSNFIAPEDKDFYLDVPTGQLFEHPDDKIEFEVGSIRDDIEFLRSDLDRNCDSSPYMLCHMYTILRLLAEKPDDFLEKTVR